MENKNSIPQEERVTVTLSTYNHTPSMGQEVCECARCNAHIIQGNRITIRLCTEDDDGNVQFHNHDYVLCRNCAPDYSSYIVDTLRDMFTFEQLPELDDEHRKVRLW